MKATTEELARIRQQEYLRPTEAAILARKSKKTIYEAIYSGELDALCHDRRYLIPRAELDKWMRQRAGHPPTYTPIQSLHRRTL